jgi:hypothetical protein
MACLTNYTVQCTDITTGKKGCFFFDQTHWQETGEFKATGEIYPDLQTFYENTAPKDRKSIYLERRY